MASKITAYRVFIASPTGLEAERKAFRKILNEENEINALERGVLFIPMGWEMILGGVGRPQELINKDILRSDYFILVLWDRWGSPSNKENRSEYTSGSEEEYNLALNSLKGSMQQVAVFFKALNPRQLSDAGPQLQKVLDFKQKLEAEKNLLYQMFDEINTFESYLRRYLANWVLRHERGGGQEMVQPVTSPQKITSYGVTMETSIRAAGALESEPAKKAGKLVAEDRLAEAEINFAEATVRGDDVDAINGYGLFLRSAGRNSQAKVVFNKALELAKQRDDKVWEAVSLNNLALVYYDQADFAEAEPLFKQALEIRQKALGPEHPDVANSLNNLAVLTYDQGRYAEAEELFKQALEIREKALGPNHPDVAKSLFRLATLYHFHEQENYAKAEPLYQQALDIQRKALGPAHPDLAWSLNGLAALYLKQNKFDKAEVLFKQALEIRKRALGPAHPDLAWSIDGLAALYLKQNKYNEAESLCKRGLTIREKALGQNHPYVAISLDSYAALLSKMQHTAEAAEIEARAKAIRARTLNRIK